MLFKITIRFVSQYFEEMTKTSGTNTFLINSKVLFLSQTLLFSSKQIEGTKENEFFSNYSC